MFKKTITFTDFNGNERTEDFYFNLTKAEITKMELSINGGYSEMIRKVMAEQDAPTIMQTFERFILDSYGEKSMDGREFIKSPEITAKFQATEAYSVLFMELCTNSEKAAEFVNGVIPKDMPNPEPAPLSAVK